MRKLLGLLVAAVFVVTAASSAMAVTLSSSTQSKQAFRAEVFFFQTGAAEFGFDLYRLAGTKPAGGDVTAAEIDWDGVAGIVPGNGDPTDKGFKASKVYAKITNNAYTAGTKVFFYTDNTDVTLSTSQYKYTVDSATTPWGVGSAHTINALVERDAITGNTSAGYATLPLAYRLEVAGLVDGDAGYDVAGANYSNNTSSSAVLNQDGGVLFYVTDKAKIANPQEVGSGAYDPAYATISTPAGMKNWDGYANADQTDFYMFFASNFTNAFYGKSYGTDRLTVELVVTP